MPLSHNTSTDTFRKNVAAETKAGKPPKQAAAVAFAAQRQAESHANKRKPPAAARGVDGMI